MVAEFRQTYDTVFVHRVPRTISKHTITERIESRRLPAELVDTGGGLGVLVEVHLQLCQPCSRCRPEVVTEALDTLRELLHTRQIFLFEFDDFFLSTHVGQFEDTHSIDGVADVEERTKDEVRPREHLTICAQRNVMVIHLLEAVVLQEVLIGWRRGITQLRFRLTLYSGTNGFVPSTTTWYKLDEFVDVQVTLMFLITKRYDIGNIVNDGDTNLRIACIQDALVCVPDDEIFFG